MSLLYSASYFAQNFPPSIAETPSYLLWSPDPHLSARLLNAIASEAANRKLPTHAFYDPLLPTRMCGLWVQGLGNFTTHPAILTNGGILIDCTSCCDTPSASATKLTELIAKKQYLEEKIADIATLLQTQSQLRKDIAQSMVDTDALYRRAIGIARRTPHGAEDSTVLPILSYTAGESEYRLPFAQEVRIVGMTAQYGLAPLFLDVLLDALAKRHCQRVILENALTHQPIGVWLPTGGVCYLTQAPAEICEKQLSLTRYLLPHTQPKRHLYRTLTSACKTWEGYLSHTLEQYQSLCQSEEAIYASLYTANRLQNFRKRLLIELFCKDD